MKSISHYISINNVGGVETIIGDLLRYFPNPITSHYLVLYSGVIHKFYTEAAYKKNVSIKRIKYFGPLKLPKRPHLVRKWNTERIMNLIDSDIIIFWNYMNQDGYLKSKDYLRRSKFIFYDHGSSWYREKDYKNCKMFLENIDLALCCSNASKRILELYHQYKGDARVILNPLRRGFLYDTAKEKTLPSNRLLRLGVVGRLIHIKGINLAIHAVYELRKRGIDVELFVAGIGKEASSYKKLTNRLNLEKKIHFLGLVKDMRRYFNNIDIFICPSIREPFGLVAVEAMSMGCPLICTRIDGLAEVVTEGKTGISLSPKLPLKTFKELGGGLNGLPEFVYNPDLDALDSPKAVDPTEVADAVEYIASNPGCFKSMSKAGIVEASQRFDFSSYMEKLLYNLSE